MELSTDLITLETTYRGNFLGNFSRHLPTARHCARVYVNAQNFSKKCAENAQFLLHGSPVLWSNAVRG
jgi:hypothetical protein